MNQNQHQNQLRNQHLNQHHEPTPEPTPEEELEIDINFDYTTVYQDAIRNDEYAIFEGTWTANKDILFDTWEAYLENDYWSLSFSAKFGFTVRKDGTWKLDLNMFKDDLDDESDSNDDGTVTFNYDLTIEIQAEGKTFSKKAQVTVIDCLEV